MQIVSVTPYNVNRGKHPKTPLLFYLFSGVSNLRILQATYLKFAEYVDIVKQIIYAKFNNDRATNIVYTSLDYRVYGNGKKYNSMYFTVLYFISFIL